MGASFGQFTSIDGIGTLPGATPRLHIMDAIDLSGIADASPLANVRCACCRDIAGRILIHAPCHASQALPKIRGPAENACRQCSDVHERIR